MAPESPGGTHAMRNAAGRATYKAERAAATCTNGLPRPAPAKRRKSNQGMAVPFSKSCHAHTTRAGRRRRLLMPPSFLRPWPRLRACPRPCPPALSTLSVPRRSRASSPPPHRPSPKSSPPVSPSRRSSSPLPPSAPPRLPASLHSQHPSKLRPFRKPYRPPFPRRPRAATCRPSRELPRPTCRCTKPRNSTGGCRRRPCTAHSFRPSSISPLRSRRGGRAPRCLCWPPSPPSHRPPFSPCSALALHRRPPRRHPPTSPPPRPTCRCTMPCSSPSCCSRPSWSFRNPCPSSTSPSKPRRRPLSGRPLRSSHRPLRPSRRPPSSPRRP
mmetsp:Transcript_99840/g.286787  ORF Transcript_99840/g.286787 Transcript_99840/m.286787 type:complete len:327 (+) Transcript_99840:30-1010(+)